MSVLTPHQTDLTTFCKFKREHKLRRALHLSLNPYSPAASRPRAGPIHRSDSVARGRQIERASALRVSRSSFRSRGVFVVPTLSLSFERVSG